MTIDELAALILDQKRARIAAVYSQSQADAERVTVRPGPVYTKIDQGPEHNMSGFLMIENSTGRIYGIKGYGRVHKGHYYGTLDTADKWYWGEYGPMRKPETPSAEVQPMEPGALGRFVCVARGGCLHSPRITIHSNWVWVRSLDPDPLNPDSHLYSSAHRDCFEASQARKDA